MIILCRKCGFPTSYEKARLSCFTCLWAVHTRETSHMVVFPQLFKFCKSLQKNAENGTRLVQQNFVSPLFSPINHSLNHSQSNWGPLMGYVKMAMATRACLNWQESLVNFGFSTYTTGLQARSILAL